VEAFRERFGHYIHNGYGLTETNSPTHVVPRGVDAPVDPASGTLAVGVPAYNVESYIGDDEGKPMAVGEVGEIISRADDRAGILEQAAGERQGHRRRLLPHRGCRVHGRTRLVLLVDRKKDMINASGYKVWPREVEDVLYTHPAGEAAVVGVPDAYRGETVKAVVSLKPGRTPRRKNWRSTARPGWRRTSIPRGDDHGRASQDRYREDLRRELRG
jgi:long-chain acyl-CoA synthetase